ncbi:MAG: TMEM165/GDT1 family protein [Kiritimatiellia bacterium]|jgi:putative Ca2+/H+ antiporter (TMEM165/GDT1 family)
MLAKFFKVFFAIFVAELGDKTQLSCLAFSSVAPREKWAIFAASSLALACSSAIAVFFGCQITRIVSPKTIKLVAGVVFIVFGVLYLREAFQAPGKV